MNWLAVIAVLSLLGVFFVLGVVKQDEEPWERDEDWDDDPWNLDWDDD
jgi:hypothetical protein